LIRAIRTLQEAMQESSWQMALARHPGGVIGTHTDGGKMPVAQHEWHLDHARAFRMCSTGEVPPERREATVAPQVDDGYGHPKPVKAGRRKAAPRNLPT
jgi:hypothetical protein